MLAYDYPLLGAFVTMIWFFLWVIWIWLLIKTIADIFRSDDLRGLSKALWLIFVIVLPYLGVLVYVIARGDGMGRRDLARAQAQEDAFRSYVQTVGAGAGSSGTADELVKLADLKDRGVITDAELQQQKARLLG